MAEVAVRGGYQFLHILLRPATAAMKNVQHPRLAAVSEHGDLGMNHAADRLDRVLPDGLLRKCGFGGSVGRHWDRIRFRGCSPALAVATDSLMNDERVLTQHVAESGVAGAQAEFDGLRAMPIAVRVIEHADPSDQAAADERAAVPHDGKIRIERHGRAFHRPIDELGIPRGGRVLAQGIEAAAVGVVRKGSDGSDPGIGCGALPDLVEPSARHQGVRCEQHDIVAAGGHAAIGTPREPEPALVAQQDDGRRSGGGQFPEQRSDAFAR